MLSPGRARSVLIAGVLAAALGGAVLSTATSAGAAGPSSSESTTVTAPGGGAIKLKGTGVGFTVSWLPTTTPVQATPGETTTGSFYVTNQTTQAIPVAIGSGTAVPGTNGTLEVRPGADARFSAIVYSPDTFVSQPKTTTTVSVTVTTPKDLAPGIYIVPAIVRPMPSKGPGNIQIQQEIDALVTFQVPGAVNANLKPSFVGPGGSTTVHHVPGLPTIQLGTSGNEVLRIVNDSPSDLYSYNEINATQTPFGNVVFKGHTPGDSHDLRNDVALFFPNLHRDYPMAWHPSSLGIGNAHITAYVSFHPNPGEIAQKSTSVEVLVISPLWTLLPAVVLALLVLLGLRRRKGSPPAEPMRRSLASRIGQVVGSLILAFVALVGAFLSSPMVFAVVSLVGVVGAVALVADGRRRSRPAMANRIAVYEALMGIVLLAGAVSVLLSIVWTLSADIAVGFVASSAVWMLLAWWVRWWNEERPGPAAAAPSNLNLPGAEEDLVSSAT
jgi:hypothetical protein